METGKLPHLLNQPIPVIMYVVLRDSLGQTQVTSCHELSEVLYSVSVNPITHNIWENPQTILIRNLNAKKYGSYCDL
jgi:hypothetical protein